MATYQEQTSGTLPYWTDLQKNLLQQGQNVAGNQLNNYFANIPQQGVAGLTPDQQQAFALARSSAGSWQPALDQSQQFLTQAGQGAQFDPNQVQQYLNPYLSGVIGEIGRLGQQGFQETIAPEIASQFGGLGQYGSARQAMALAEAGGRQQRETLGQQAGALKSAYDTAMQGYRDWTQMGIGAKQAAGTGLGNLAQQQQGLYTGDIANLATAGATQQQQAQKALDAQYQQWQTQQQYPWESLNQWANLFKTGQPQTSTSWNTGFKKGGLARFADGGRFRDEEALERLLDEKGVEDPAIRARVKALAMQESGGRLDAYGPVVPSGMHKGDRAFGMFQLMPNTAEELGGVDMSNPESATAGGLDYFLRNQERFGDLDLATIAHHAGPGGAERFRSAGSAGTRDLATGLPTDDYLNRVKSLERQFAPVAPPTASPSVPMLMESAPSPMAVAGGDTAGLARQAFDERMKLLERARTSPDLAPLDQGDWMTRVGEAMMRAGAEGPANIGQLIGRSGAAYFDKEATINAENKKRALERLAIEERIVPDVPRTLAGARGAASGLSPEQLKTVYTGVRNEVAQRAKNFKFDSPEEEAVWIEQETNRGVDNYLTRYATQPTGPRGTGQAPSAAGVTSPSPGEKPTTEAIPVTPPGAPAAPTGQVIPKPRNRAEEARQKTAAVGGEEVYIEDYKTNILPAAEVADTTLQQVNALRQIPFTPGKLTPIKETVGSWMDALGMDGTLARDAQNIQQVRPLLSNMVNRIMLLAKGTQTEGDAQRVKDELAKMTDTQQAFDFALTWMEETAKRSKFKKDLYEQGAKAEGSWAAGSNMWGQSDYGQTAPVARIDGDVWSFTEFRERAVEANPNATISQIIDKWNSLTRGE